jgi:hypothetical protein
VEFGYDEPQRKCLHVQLLKDQLCNSLIVGDAVKHDVVPLMARLLKDSGVCSPCCNMTVFELSSSVFFCVFILLMQM